MAFVRKVDNVDDVMAVDVNELQGAIEGLDWRLSATVATDNLTVALKNSAGNDPTAVAPVRVQIGDTVREVSAALSVTAAAATNWFAAGSAELAAKEIDYFVYLGYNATDGVTLGFARIPFARIYSDFSATTTNEKFCKISTITTAAASDPYTVIGRFAATLSAGAGYTWTVPTFTAANLVHQPVYNTRALTWTPAASASGSMTFTTVTINLASYWINNRDMRFEVQATGTIGGTPNTSVILSLPFTALNAATNPAQMGWVNTAGTAVGGYSLIVTNNLHLRRYDVANWTAGAARVGNGNGICILA